MDPIFGKLQTHNVIMEAETNSKLNSPVAADNQSHRSDVSGPRMLSSAKTPSAMSAGIFNTERPPEITDFKSVSLADESSFDENPRSP